MKIKEKVKKVMKVFSNKKAKFFLLALAVVLSFVLYILFINIEARKMEIYTDVNFITPTQALVFWKTKEDTIGYVQYGESKFGTKEVELQTSSEPGEIHVVILENVPKEGLYIQKRNESDSFFVFPKVQYIKYEIEEDIYEEF